MKHFKKRSFTYICIVCCFVIYFQLIAQNKGEDYSDYNQEELRVKFLGFGMDVYCGGLDNNDFMTKTFGLFKSTPNTALEYSVNDREYYISVSDFCDSVLMTIPLNNSIKLNDSIIINVSSI